MLSKLNRKTAREQSVLCMLFEFGLIFAGLFLLLYMIPHSINIFNYVRVQNLYQSIVQGKLLPLSFTQKPITGPIFSIPLWLFGNWYKSPGWWCARYNFLVFSAGLFFIYRLLRNQMNKSTLRKFLIILIAASMFPNHLRVTYHEVFTAIMVGVGLLAITLDYTYSGWTAVILGVGNTPASLVGLGCVVLKQALDKKRWRYFLLLVVGVLVICAEQWIREGYPFTTGYEGDVGWMTMMPYSGQPGFSYPFFFGLLSILFSFGRGLVFFAPGLLLFLKNKLHLISQQVYDGYKLWIYFLIGMVLVYSKWWGWYGGVFWGPRFFLFASIPASFALAVHLQDRDKSLMANLFTLAVLGWSVWLGVSGAVFDQYSLDICVKNNFALEALCWYVPEFSVLFRPFVVTKPLCMHNLTIMAYCLVVFIYLAAPLFKRLSKQLPAKLAALKATYLDFGNWGY